MALKNIFGSKYETEFNKRFNCKPISLKHQQTYCVIVEIKINIKTFIHDSFIATAIRKEIILLSSYIAYEPEKKTNKQTKNETSKLHQILICSKESVAPYFFLLLFILFSIAHA